MAVLLAEPQQDVIVDPPHLVIEILSPADTYSDTQERARDYSDMGVETIWIVDPRTRSGRVCSGRVWTKSDRLEVRGTLLYVDLPEIFSRLNPEKVGILS